MEEVFKLGRGLATPYDDDAIFITKMIFAGKNVDFNIFSLGVWIGLLQGLSQRWSTEDGQRHITAVKKDMSLNVSYIDRFFELYPDYTREILDGKREMVQIVKEKLTMITEPDLLCHLYLSAELNLNRISQHLMGIHSVVMFIHLYVHLRLEENTEPINGLEYL